MKLSRVDRIQRTFDVATLFPQLDPATVTSVLVGLLPPLGRNNASPTAATAWTAYTVASGSVTVMFVGPDADSTSAVAVPATADLWAKAAGSFGEVEAVWVDRITVTGSNATLLTLPVPFVVSVVGATGAVTGTQIAADAAVRSAYVPKWKPTTAYTAGEFVLNPSGQIVSANSSFTSGASYVAGNWTVVSSGALLAASNLSDIASASTARTNLGLGSAATQPTSAFDASGAASTAAALRAPLLTPTATKTATYTAAVGDLAMMNVAGGGTPLGLPTAPADKAQVAYRAIGATTAVPLVVNRGGSTDTIGTAGATSASLPMADEVVVLQYDAPNTRWLAVSAVKTQASLDARFAAYAKTAQLRWNARRQANYERDNAIPFTVYVDSVRGSDANTGASPAQAYATLGKLTTATIAAGARIGLARGSTFTGNYTVPTATGTLSPTNRVVFGAYGVGAAPKISAGTFTIAQPYIDVQDMRFTGASGGYALFVFNATAGVMIDNRVKRCEIDNNTQSGGMIIGTIGGLVEDCYVHDNWTGVEYPSGNGTGMMFTTGTDSTECRYNTVRNCYKGIGAANTHRDVNIHHNIVDKQRVNGIDMGSGGVVAHPPKIVNNFVWHRPTTPNGHGIDTQASATGHFSRNNVVYSDYTGAAGNVELYCVDSTTYTDGDYDYNLGYMTPTCTATYGKLGLTTYATLALYQAALNGTSYLGKEAHSIQADPLIADLTNLLFMPLPGSPAIDAGIAVGGVTDLAGYLGTAPDLGPFEVG